MHYSIYETDFPGLKDKVTGSFYAGVLQGLLNYAGVQCDRVDFKCQFKEKEKEFVTLFEIFFNEKYKTESN